MKQQNTKKAWYKKWWVWVIIFIVILAVSGSASRSGTTSEKNNGESTTIETPKEKEWKTIATLEGTEDNKKTDVFVLKEGDVRVRYEVEGKTDTSTSMLYLIKEGATKSRNERGDLDIAPTVAMVIGTENSQKISKQHAGNYYFEMNASGVFKYKVFIEQQ